MESVVASGNNQTTNTTSFSDLGLRLVVADVTQVTPDFRLTLDDLDIHGDDNYVPIEFAGTITTVLFSVSHQLYS